MIRFHAMTDAGKVRAHNEDAVFADGQSGVFAVADGVGGRGCSASLGRRKTHRRKRSEMLGENDIPAAELRLGRKFASFDT